MGLRLQGHGIEITGILGIDGEGQNIVAAEAALASGIDRVVLGTDYPAPMLLHDAVNWVNGLIELTEAEKTAILSANPGRVLGP